MSYQGLRINSHHYGLTNEAGQRTGYLYDKATPPPGIEPPRLGKVQVTLCEKSSPCPCINPCLQGQHIARRMHPGNPGRPRKAGWLVLHGE